MLDFRRVDGRIPEGKYINIDNSITGATYHFEIASLGLGVAILGDNPFRSPSIIEVIKSELNREPPTGDYVVVLEGEILPDTLRSGESLIVKVAAGKYGQLPMGDTFTLPPKFYTDSVSREYETRVTIRANSGDVLSVTTATPQKSK